MNYKLTLCKKYKVEQTAFRIKPNLDMISSIGSSLATIDLIKFCTGTTKDQFRVPHINISLGTVWFEKNPELTRKLSKGSLNFDVSLSGSEVYSEEVEGAHERKSTNGQETELEVETLQIEEGDLEVEIVACGEEEGENAE